MKTLLISITVLKLCLFPPNKGLSVPSYQNNHVTTEMPPVVTVSVVKILCHFEPISKMLVGTWLASTVLNSWTHKKTTFSAITLKKVCLIAENRCLVVTFLKVTH